MRREAVTLPAVLTEKLMATLDGAVPVANFDAYFGDSSFGRKHLSKIPQKIIARPNFT